MLFNLFFVIEVLFFLEIGKLGFERWFFLVFLEVYDRI